MREALGAAVMNKRSKNLTVIGAVLAFILFLCGLFHNELFVRWVEWIGQDDREYCLIQMALLPALLCVLGVLMLLVWLLVRPIYLWMKR